MSLSREDVEKVALLARLQLAPDELETMTGQLSHVISYVEHLAELDEQLPSVEPMAHAMDVVNVFADDEPRPGFDREQMLANAPKRDAECYRVPAVLGE